MIIDYKLNKTEVGVFKTRILKSLLKIQESSDGKNLFDILKNFFQSE